MLRLVTHIEHLLLVHDCVIVPKLGGFVLQPVPASYAADEHIFRPMRKELLFNSTLKHQDGLLAEAYMKMYRADYRRAVEMIDEDVEAMLTRLNSSGRIDMGRIGVMSVGDEGQYVFNPAEGNPLSVEAYCLPSFYFTPLSLLKKEEDDLYIPSHKPDEKKKDAIYIRINRNVLRACTAAAAVIALVLLISTPVKEVNPSRYTASFIPSGMTASKAAVDEMVTEIQPPVFTPVPATEDVVAQPEVQPAVAVSNGKVYYAVIGSFPNEELGNKFITESVDRVKYPHVSYVRKGDKVRVFSEKFDNREDAEIYVNALRQTEEHKNAWLFISR